MLQYCIALLTGVIETCLGVRSQTTTIKNSQVRNPVFLSTALGFLETLDLYTI
jgi:hypothetical protein